MLKIFTRFSTYTLLVALAISAVAEFYSIVGLTAIFSAAVIPVVIMGVVLGLGKIMATIWLKLNWDRAPLSYKLYLIPAIIVLMFLTSMGIFGFLSQAHSDQSLVSGDVQSKIAIYDEKIKISKENIEANRKALKQMDEAVDQVMGRSSDEKGADKAVAIRRAQQKERARLVSEIQAEQAAIGKLNEERAPIAAEVRKVEAEVGPLKYIAAMIYGDNPDANLLESAVRWVIIIIVAVFDPLALVLLLAAQQSFRWERQREEEEQLTPDPYVADVGEKPTQDELPMEDDEQAIEDWLERGRLVARDLDRQEEQNRINAANALLAEVEREVSDVFIDKVDTKFDVEISPAEWPQQTKSEPAYEADDGPLTDEQVTQLKSKVALFAPVEPVVEKSVLFEESDPTINCHKCETELVNAPGIGMFCPNKQCDVMDGPFNGEEPIQFTFIPPAPLSLLKEDEVVSAPEEPVIVAPSIDDERPGDYLTEELVDRVDVSSEEITVDSTIIEEPDPIVATEPEVVIETENVTAEKQMFDPSSSHVMFEGKKMSIDNLRSIRPDLIRTTTDSFPNKIDFGNEFPKYSVSGDTYIRIDVMPHRVYKFNGTKWMNVEKNENTTYLSNSQYLQYLINRLEQGKYDPELLTEIERDEIELFIVKKS
jgi:hypothetical protein